MNPYESDVRILKGIGRRQGKATAAPWHSSVGDPS